MRLLTFLTVLTVMIGCSDEPNNEIQKQDTKAQHSVDQAVNNSPHPLTQNAKIVQPDAPGKPTRTISAEAASNLAHILYTDADVEFMQGMIMHHAQAIDMTNLVADRSENPELIQLAERIDISQKDEIKTMQNWLKARDKDVTSEHAHHAHGAEMMPGMLTPEEMQQLADAKTNAFDKLFLELMIKHHYGALIMVDELLENSGAAQESMMYTFASDINADQKMEIERMAKMLASLSPDPRVGLTAGYLDAESSANNIELKVSIPRPPGFFSPQNPAGFAVLEQEDDAPKTSSQPEEKDADAEEREAQSKKFRQEGKEREASSALFNFANTDLAFAEDFVVVGNYHGFNIFEISNPEKPSLVSSVVCPGGQGDVSIVENLLIMSVEQTRGRIDCGLQGVADVVSDERMRGIRIFDISDLTTPKQVGLVQTCRGSHTHTVVTDPDTEGKFYVYVSGIATVRKGEELAGCSDAQQDPNSALFSIDVVEISLKDPAAAKIVNQPRIFADFDSGSIAGLWQGGDHGRNTQDTAVTDHCHDITVFPELKLAAGACSGNGILMDITDPLNPKRLDAVTDKGFAYWHSATFNNDGTKVIFTDEWGGGGQPRCRANDPASWGANAIFDIVDNKLEFRSYYKLPAPQSDKENCVAHNGSLVPVPGRDIMVQAWYQGGLSLFDFTDSSNPIEIGHFDRGPVNKDHLIVAGYWSVYWHQGLVYGSEIARGFDVLKLSDSEFITANELAAANTIDSKIVNAQYQKMFKWPAKPEVALAYTDQLARLETVNKTKLSELKDLIKSITPSSKENKNQAIKLAELLVQESQSGNSRVQTLSAALLEVVRSLEEV
ncbi:DUF305 domain-containing protein [Aliikangiella marina]|uniref:DUF305 domain-containing protein n=1 Tax=Aliikangiella marina TaxID=1712262 RepID=A0A545TH13_9GAMM|nr:DUF305 domain-containing protein [Aliikangiella marina]TQV76513.1 DUF305 domain-containing protein [Aliikangiella marina]